MTDSNAEPLDEFGLIARYFDRPAGDASVVLGPGDDAALIEPTQTLAMSTDTLNAGVHFLDDIDPARLGERALAVNLSDMAAMGAQPRWFLLSLTLARTQASWLEGFAAGLHACAQRYGVSLIGGDVTGGALAMSIHILGEVPRTQALLRSGAACGDAVFVTGTLGDAAAGLRLAGEKRDDDADKRWLIDRYELPTPRVAAGIALRGIATAAIDVSDGLLADLGWICKASGCAADVDVAAVPLSAPLSRRESLGQARRFALSGGDDYELCFTAPGQAEERVRGALAQVGVAVTRIGECRAGHGVHCRLDGRPYAAGSGGFAHFS